MTDWDKPWENKPFSIESLTCDEKGNSVETDKMKWEKQVKAVGDAMQQENVQLRKDVKELANMGSDDLHRRIETEALLQLANTRLNVLAKELGETQQKLEEQNIIRIALAKTVIEQDQILEAMQSDLKTQEYVSKAFDKRIWELEQKLEAIRGIIEYEDVTECIEKIQHVLDGGVRKEMQKEDSD